MDKRGRRELACVDSPYWKWIEMVSLVLFLLPTMAVLVKSTGVKIPGDWTESWEGSAENETSFSFLCITST